MYRFNPGQQIARADMRDMLGAWLPNSGLSHLQAAWSRGPELQRSVADLVCNELEHWRGDTASVSEDIHAN